MRKLYRQALAALLFLTGCAPSSHEHHGINHWIVYYSDEHPSSYFEDYDLVVFDLNQHPDIAPLKKSGTITLAYVSIGEVHPHVPELKTLEKHHHVLKKNEVWGSFVVDMAAREWQDMVMDQVADAINQGFDGVMLDTVESPLAWAKEKGPKRYAAMREAGLLIIHKIREKYPNIKIMLNRGFEILNDAAPDIDYLLAESTLTYRDDFNGQFILYPPDTYADVVAQLHGLLARQQLNILTLDYWNTEDVEGLQTIYAKQRAIGFTPYVTSPDLRHYTPEPPPRA
jgi:uncharacterized protein (TIGR01370 family)